MVKRIFTLTLVLLMISTVALADSIGSIVPDNSYWGISRKQLQKITKADYETLEIGKKKVLHCSNIEVNNLAMDAYYVFDYSTWDETGYTYNGLSKIVYLLSNYRDLKSSELKEIKKQLIEAMSVYAGQQDSNSDEVAIWNKRNYKIEIGIGNFKKYSGSKHKNVAIVITGLDIPKPVTPPPTPEPTPQYTYIPKVTPPPRKDYPTLDYNGASHYPDSYNNKYVKFPGEIYQVIENPTIEIDGKSLYYDYELLVSTKKDKWGDYSDENVYVYVYKKDIKGGGRLLEDEKIWVYGQYGGIESYIGGFVSHTISIPRVYANHISRK